MSASFTVMAGSRMSAKESTSDIMWPSNTSGLGREMVTTEFSRYLIFSLVLLFVLIHAIKAVLQGNHNLEGPFPSKYPAVIGSFVLYSPLFLPDGLLLDGKWEYCGIRQIEPRRKSFTVGESVRRLPTIPALSVPGCDLQLCGAVSGVIYLHEHGIIHGDLKGVCLDIATLLFVSLIA